MGSLSSKMSSLEPSEEDAAVAGGGGWGTVQWPLVRWNVVPGAVVDGPQTTVGGVGDHGDVGVVWAGACEGRNGQSGSAVVRPLCLPWYVVGDDAVNGT